MSWDLQNWNIRPSKHFVMGWMKKWDWTTDSIRTAIEMAHRIDKVGKTKYEAHTHQGKGSKKIIFVKDEERREIFVITGAEGT